MQQSDVITSRSEFNNADEQLTAFDRLRQLLALRAAPQQVNSVSSSDDEFHKSLSPAELNYVYEMASAWSAYAHGQIDVGECNRRCEVAAGDAVGSGITHERKCAIRARAKFFSDEALELENINAQVAFRRELYDAVKRFKKGDGHTFHRCDLKNACHMAYWCAKRELLTDAQAREITLSIARSLKMHSGEQLWRYVKTNEALEYLQALHFDD